MEIIATALCVKL